MKNADIRRAIVWVVKGKGRREREKGRRQIGVLANMTGTSYVVQWWPVSKVSLSRYK